MIRHCTYVVLAMSLAASAHAEERGAWFKSLKIPATGSSCCDLADCHKVEARWEMPKAGVSAFGHWEALSNQGMFTPIPEERVVTDPPSIDGDAYLCESPNGAIYCFVPPRWGS